ncbi:SDR family NAD(P)-dependent oxidoreductase [Bacillus sp. B15-48]|uniref:SDR family NAD(P)-dependent oxidoreductase n=1 Tax=Bacillus sp. B15-48 TaxID=1548601 RepID=UPI00193F6CB0|nr:SDR family NAD(P)-dependent oxidoreductase [Bacillus sp. B15-48]MBM4764773.1 SDR family NAD(P)-dependent oxidoreductase [Bacillus sp. B15-48]
MKEIKGKTAVVTGAGGGMGRSIALALANEGANVVVVDIEEELAKAVAAEVAEYGVGSLGLKADVSKLKDIEAVADAAYDKFKSVEILCNNAGVTLRPFRAHWDASYEDWNWMMNINFWGVLNGHLTFVPRMMNTPGEKHIVNTSSMASLMDIAGHAAYSASKAAVDGLSNSAREELKLFDIGVSVFHPGAVRTRITTSDRLMDEKHKSEQKYVKSWSDYVNEISNPIVESKKVVEPEIDPDVPTNAFEYISPKHTGMFVIEGILKNKPHIMTHPLPMDKIQSRFDGILGAVPTYPES